MQSINNTIFINSIYFIELIVHKFKINFAYLSIYYLNKFYFNNFLIKCLHFIPHLKILLVAIL